MIRDIVSTDKEKVLRLLRLFFKERLEKAGLHFAEDTAENTFDFILNTSGTISLFIDIDGEISGVIAGFVSPIIFAKELALQELVWYVESGKRKHGIKLLREFEKRAKEKGVDYVMMIGMSGDPVLNFYPHFGYKETQVTFFKELG